MAPFNSLVNLEIDRPTRWTVRCHRDHNGRITAMADDGISKIKIQSFTAVRGTDAAGMVQWISRIERFPEAVRIRNRSYELLDVGPDDLVVDVGCGAGGAGDELADRAATAIGIDTSEQMIEVSRRRFPGRDFRHASAYELPFADASVSAYRAERVFQHLERPADALAEAYRALAGGGRIVLLDQDYDSPTIDADDLALCRTILRAQSDAIRQRWIGRQYRGLLLDAGFVDVTVEVNTSVYTDYQKLGPMIPAIAAAAVEQGAVRQEQADAWLADQHQRGERDRFFATMPIFTAFARKPGT
jgi:ubiquinone/menaquinone biosynthesis C-methylase UbiE